MPPSIVIENLSKKYIIKQQRQQGSSYVSLRDVLSEKAQALGRQLIGSRSASLPATQQEFWALKDINLEIAQGDKLAIIGHNGAGKSTLLKILSRITEPTTGRVTLNGRIASLLEVGTGFHPELTGRENIFLNGSILGMSQREIKRKFDEIVDFAGVEMFLDTPVKRYSSGMRMRLGFAVAAHLESEIMVIDEVLAVGDTAFQKKCLGKMDEVSQSEGRTILFVSHNTDIVQSLCNKAVVLNKGHVLFEGDVRPAIEMYCQNIKETSGADRVFKTETLELVAADLAQNGQDDALSVYEGRPVRLSLSIRALKPHKNVTIMVVLMKMTGEIQSFLSTDLTGAKIDLSIGENKVFCDIEDFPFLSGTYHMNVKVIGESEEMLYAPEYKMFFVKDGERGQAMQPYRKWAGEALLTHRWQKGER